LRIEALFTRSLLLLYFSLSMRGLAHERDLFLSLKVVFRNQAHLPLSYVAKATNWPELVPVAIKKAYRVFCQAECGGVLVRAVSEKDFAVYKKHGIRLSAYNIFHSMGTVVLDDF
jgi:hypothetical protein